MIISNNANELNAALFDLLNSPRKIVVFCHDSDFVRVRVLGLPPAASELQFIDFSRVQEARQRKVETLPDEPLIAGFDVSGGGAAWNVIRFRRGLDGRGIPPIRIPGSDDAHVRDVLVAIISQTKH
jgi:hypothetical protein